MDDSNDSLKQAAIGAISGSIPISGVVTPEMESAVEPTDRADTAKETRVEVEGYPETTCDKVLAVESGSTNSSGESYQFSITDGFNPRCAMGTQMYRMDDPEIAGEIENGDIDVYFFKGEVEKASARGVISYSVYDWEHLTEQL